jgi:hypothetical protein
MTTREAVRQLFLRPETTYTIDSAAALLGWTTQELSAELAAQHLLSEYECLRRPVLWHDVALLIVSESSYEVIEQHLGADACVLPPLVRLDDLRVRIPRFEIMALRSAAKRQRVSINTLLSRNLLDLTCTEASHLSSCSNNFDEAFRWPSPRRKVEARRLTSR